MGQARCRPLGRPIRAGDRTFLADTIGCGPHCRPGPDLERRVARVKSPNAVLAGKIAESGFSQEELAELLNQASRRLGEREGRASDRYVRNLLDGTVSWPQPRYRRCLELIFGCSVLDLGFIPPNGRGYGGSSHVAREEVELPVLRREFLLHGVRGAAWLAMSRIPDEGRIGMGDVERLRRGLRDLHEQDDLFGGGAVVDSAVAAARQLQALAESGRASERVGRALFSVAGTYWSTAGWFAFDAGDAEGARHHFNDALRAGLISGDALLQAQTWNYMSLQVRHDNPVEATAIGRAALGSTVVRRDAKLGALFHFRVAQGHAGRGERGMAQRALARAVEAFEKADDRERPLWLEFFDQSEVAGLKALLALTFGQYRLAEAELQDSRGGPPTSGARNLFIDTVRLAGAQLGVRDVDRAADTGHAALDVVPRLRSTRCAVMLHTFAGRMAAWDTAAAREWTDRYRLVSQTAG